jgi:hypothetical protein
VEEALLAVGRVLEALLVLRPVEEALLRAPPQPEALLVVGRVETDSSLRRKCWMRWKRA